MADERFSLANRRHLTYFVGLLIADGSLCPKCLHGARHTSKNWARCKQPGCNHRFPRQLNLHAEAKAQQQPDIIRPLGVPSLSTD